MNKQLQLIKKMHTKFGITHDKVPFTLEEKRFRHAALIEEATEYMTAETPWDELDAIIDLTVFALGTLERQGMLNLFEEAFEDVMYANMQKEVGSNGNKRNGFKLDLVKPQGWKAPDFRHLFTIENKIKQYEEDNKELINDVLFERGTNYGSFLDNAYFTQNILDLLNKIDIIDMTPYYLREYIHMLLHKISRALCGNNITYKDTYIDIIGYSKLCLDLVINDEILPISHNASSIIFIKILPIIESKFNEYLDKNEIYDCDELYTHLGIYFTSIGKCVSDIYSSKFKEIKVAAFETIINNSYSILEKINEVKTNN
mgnify:CR=1 FL=1